MKLIEGPVDGYDIIGDVHGEAELLERLLDQLGYRAHERGFRHPDRKAIFVGDVLDRGPNIPRAIEIVNAMVECGDGYAVLGNHELGALAIHYLGEQLSEPEREAFYRQYITTVAAFAGRSASLQEHLERIRDWPMYIECPGFRVVHACWNPAAVDVLAVHDDRSRMVQPLLEKVFEWGSKERGAALKLTNGVNLSLPIGMTLVGADGVERSTVRANFWCENPSTYADIAIVNGDLPSQIGSRQLTSVLKKQLPPAYGCDERPLFVGHYWMLGSLRLASSNVVCVDFVDLQKRRLAAYRWSNGADLDDANAWVQVWAD